MGLLLQKNELSDGICQLILIKCGQRKWKVASQVLEGEMAEISLNGPIRTKAGLHDLEEI